MVRPRGKKNNSKRQTLKTKHKIRKKVTQSKRKLKKEANIAKKAGVNIRSQKQSLARDKKKMHIPNLWPFKQEELLRQKQMADRKDADRAKMAEANRKQAAKDVKAKRKAELKVPLRPVYKFQNTVDAADLLVEVVDARDPLATRCLSVENMANKKTIIVVTKGDLVPKENLTAWLNYLRRKSGCPVLALTRREDAAKPFGFKNLVKLLQSFETKFVGVVGYPGVGKHTVENYLKIPSCQLPKKCKTQSASVIESDEVDSLSADLVLLKKPQACPSPLPILKRVLERTTKKEDLLIKLALPNFDDAEQLLKNVMNELNLQSPTDAIRQFLKKWNAVGHCCSVPVEEDKTKENSTTDNITAQTTTPEADRSLIHKNVAVDELASIYEEDAKEIVAMSTWLAEIEKKIEIGELVGSEGAVVTAVGGMKERHMSKKEAKGEISATKSSSRSTVTVAQKKAVARPDLTRVFTIKPPFCSETGKVTAGGPEPFVFGKGAGTENDMDFSDDDDDEAPALKEMGDVNMEDDSEDMLEEEDEEEDVDEMDMEGLEMLEDEEEEEEEDASDDE